MKETLRIIYYIVRWKLLLAKQAGKITEVSKTSSQITHNFKMFQLMNQKKSIYIFMAVTMMFNERRLKYLILTRSYIIQHHQLLSQNLRRKKKAEKQNKAKTN